MTPMVTRADGADNYVRAAQALGGPAIAAALRTALAAQMSSRHIPAELPAERAGAAETSLAAETNISSHLVRPP
ncbi:MAG: hypothetical protein OXH76_02555, partial [Boseongicola sp.]|nr:hypothetical protein [Boseongicola sp.]